MLSPLNRHIDSFVVRMYREVRKEVGHVLRTGLITFLIVGVGGAAILTAAIFALGKSPEGSLSIVSYVVLGVAALAGAAAAAAVHLSIAVLRGIERAAKGVMGEIERIEGEVMHTVTGNLPRSGPPESSHS